MSLVANITTPSNEKGHKVEYSTKALEVSFSLTATVAIANYAAFLALIDGVELEINKQTKNGSVAVLQRSNLLELFELAQTNGGLISGHISADKKEASIRSAVELSDFGAIPLLNGEFFELNFFNFPVDAGNAYSVVVNALDHMVESRIHNVYEKQYINANSPREIDVTEAKTLCVAESAFDKIELLYTSGRRVQFTKTEILALMRDAHEVRTILNDAGAGSSVNTIQTQVIIDVSKAVTAKMTTSSSVNVTLLKYAQIN